MPVRWLVLPVLYGTKKKQIMKVYSEVDDIRTARWADPLVSWGLVPTMGYLHEGHISLVERAIAENDCVGVSIFVNPTQFDNEADLEKYPTKIEDDLEMLRAAGVDLVWTPTPQIMYPPHFQTHVDVTALTQTLEGAARDGHFRGVATVVTKLLNVVQPRRAYFGQKDAQQVAVLKQMVADLNMNVEIVACETLRAADGLAMSSRNARLEPDARVQASCLYRSLQAVKMAIVYGETDVAVLRTLVEEIISAEPLARLEYVSFSDATTLLDLDEFSLPLLVSMAVYVGGIRLIDNFLFE